MLMMVVDALLGRVVARGPTVLVVDDVQWADPATWDALSYLVAGFSRQRLALVTTHRDEAAVGEHFQHWLGNVRRLPGTEELVLTRLDQDATGDQIADTAGPTAGATAGGAGVREVSGQPVLQRAAGAPRGPRLRRAARGPARGAQPGAAGRMAGHVGAAREIARILAIAGRPTDLRDAWPPLPRARRLRHRVGPRGRRRGSRRARARRCLVPAPAAGRGAGRDLPARRGGTGARGLGRPPRVVLRPRGSTSCAGSATSPPTTSAPATAAAAFTALLQGADLAEKLGAPREAADLLVRAADLWEVAADATDTVGHATLLERAGEACHGSGGRRRATACSARHLTSSPPSATRCGRAGDAAGSRTASLGETDDITEPTSSEPWSCPVSTPTAASTRSPGPARFLLVLGRADEEASARRDDAWPRHTARGRVGHQLGPWHPRHALLEPTSSRRTWTAMVCWEQAMASGDPEDIGGAYNVRLIC